MSLAPTLTGNQEFKAPPHLDRSQQVLCSVIDPKNNITEALGIGGPHNNHFVRAA